VNQLLTDDLKRRLTKDEKQPHAAINERRISGTPAKRTRANIRNQSTDGPALPLPMVQLTPFARRTPESGLPT
jgi:hypothetical protein